MVHRVQVLGVAPVTHNVRRYTLEKPAGYAFEPGQATEVSLDIEDWREKKRPFTFTSLGEWETLEFTIKSYLDHDGVTARLFRIEPGAHLLLRDVWGTIQYHGPGTFIAGGAGVTPFIAILRRLRKDGRLKGNRLIFSNRTEADIILRQEFEAMQAEGLELTLTVTDEPGPGLMRERIDEGFLKRHVGKFDQNFYVCGPDPMVKELRETLERVGASVDNVVWEK